jgi:hypothetical protein
MDTLMLKKGGDLFICILEKVLSITNFVSLNIDNI